ncbi:hypothetical protein DFH09DRAFT_1195746 [Mycena vulgaris]|nr:hypothetical protein DFH09DRAFT_1195746 [Mycena vulgaris]
MCCRTVQHTLMEGGVEARIQLAPEMANADDEVTGENYESGHVMINKGTSHKISESQLANLKFQINCFSTLYKQSPLGRRSALNFEVHDFLRVWKGNNADHAADAKKHHRLGKEWKRESSRILLGYEEIQQMDPPKVVEIIREIQRKNLEEVGDIEAW